jgi:hypothetical protein
MAIEIVPLSNEPIERFTYTFEGVVYRLKKEWFEIANCWLLTVEGLANNVLLQGLGMSTGYNLLEGQAVLEIGVLIVVDTHGQNEDPDFEGMGTRFQLAYVPLEDL